MRYWYPSFVCLLVSILLSCSKENRTHRLAARPVDVTLELNRLSEILEPVQASLANFSTVFANAPVEMQDSLLQIWDYNFSVPDSLYDFLFDPAIAQCQDTRFKTGVDSMLLNTGIMGVRVDKQIVPVAALGFRIDLFEKHATQISIDWLVLTSRIARIEMLSGSELGIPDTIANIARSIELFTTNYSHSALKERANQHLYSVASKLIHGIADTSYVNSDSTINKEYLRVWKQIAVHERSTELGSYIGEWYDFLSSENFRWSESCGGWGNGNPE